MHHRLMMHNSFDVRALMFPLVPLNGPNNLRRPIIEVFIAHRSFHAALHEI
jgi:hypothetical protein